MSRLKISSNLFLEVNELNRLVKFIVDDGYKRVVKPLICHFGIVRDEYNSYFKVIKSGTNVTLNPGLAFNKEMEGIVNTEQTQITLANSPLGTKKWIILSRAVTNWERGYVHIGDDGSMDGNDTEFTKVLRGQPNFPTKVMFGSTDGEELNPQISRRNAYEVVKVTNDDNALLAGDFAQQEDLRYAVIGTFTPGFNPSADNACIYEYDWYHIDIVESETRPEVEEGMEFILACVTYTNDGISVSDERDDFMFNEINNNGSGGQGSNSAADVSVASIWGGNIVSGIKSPKTIGCDIELRIDHAYHVVGYTVTSNENNTIFHINQGYNKLLGANPTLSNNLFNGWVILNRANMKSLKIINNVGNDLYISTFYDAFAESGGGVDDIIIIPPFDEIEYEVTVSHNIYDGAFPFYFRCSAENVTDRIRFYCLFENKEIPGTQDDITIGVKYRYIENGNRHPFRPFLQHSFQFQGITRVYSSGEFNIHIGDFEPEEQERNYS